MKTRLGLLAAVVAGMACNGGERDVPLDMAIQPPGPSPASAGAVTKIDWTIVPGERIGSIKKTTSRRDLVRLFGAEQVADRWIYLVEGFCTPGTVVFPASSNEVEVTWTSEDREAPASVGVSHPSGRWATDDGVRIGTTLEELERLAGEPIRFGGFGWDYGGGAAWRGLSLGLEPDADDLSTLRDHPRLDEIYGERSVRSDHPVVRALTIRVVRMTQFWAAPGQEVECPEEAFQ